MEYEALDRVLATTSLASDVFFAGEPCGDWRISNAASPGHGAAFHLVLRGTPWMHLPDVEGPPIALHEGDFVFMPRDAAHVLTATDKTPDATALRVDAVRPVGVGEEDAALVCGKLLLEEHVQRFLLAPLPEVVVMPARHEDSSSIVPGVVSIMWDEVRGKERPLSTTLSRLADVLVIQVLHFAVRRGLASSGVLAGLLDPQLRRALGRVILEPGADWSVESLASHALMSRSAFASRFLEIVGTTPVDFVREWRMQQAFMLLRTGRSVADVAHATGYESEASFAKAFKRVIGQGPGAIRPR